MIESRDTTATFNFRHPRQTDSHVTPVTPSSAFRTTTVGQRSPRSMANGQLNSMTKRNIKPGPQGAAWLARGASKFRLRCVQAMKGEGFTPAMREPPYPCSGRQGPGFWSFGRDHRIGGRGRSAAGSTCPPSMGGALADGGPALRTGREAADGTPSAAPTPTVWLPDHKCPPGCSSRRSPQRTEGGPGRSPPLECDAPAPVSSSRTLPACAPCRNRSPSVPSSGGVPSSSFPGPAGSRARHLGVVRGCEMPWRRSSGCQGIIHRRASRDAQRGWRDAASSRRIPCRACGSWSHAGP